MVTALPAQSDLVAMLPSIAMLVAFIAVAGCCVYISYRVGQVVSPTSRMLQDRIAQLEVTVTQSEKDIRASLEHHRQEAGKEARRLLEEGVSASDAQAHIVRRGLDDFGDRLNGTRVDLARNNTRFREDVEGALAGLRERAREDAVELARLQTEMIGNVSGQIRDLGSESERRQERAMVALEAISSDLKTIYATSASELHERVTADLAEARTMLAHVAQGITGQGKQLDGVEQTIRGALRESAGNQAALSVAIEGKLVALNAAITGKQDALSVSLESKQDAHSASIEGKQDALHLAIASQFARFRDEASAQLAQVLAVDERLEGSWGLLKGDFDAITKSLVQISRAVDVLKNELTVKLQDGSGAGAVHGLLERVLQPTEFERDVEIEPGTKERVAFAVRLSDNPITRVWLPIATLPVVQGYNEFVAASVYSDIEGMKGGSQTFERAILAAAEELSSKFICPPRTLNLAVLLAPSDDMFEEIARRDSLVDEVQRNFHVMIAGPATLPTLLTGLRMAFKGTATATARLANGPQGLTLPVQGD